MIHAVRNRREFLRQSVAMVTGASVALELGFHQALAATGASTPSRPPRAGAQVAIVPCRSYGREVKGALARCFDLLGGVGSLVRNKTVTIKLNLTGTNFQPFLGRPVGESYMTHASTALALGALLCEAGAKRLQFVESTQRVAGLETTLEAAGWDVPSLSALGHVTFENTRNLGKGKRYASFRVPGGGYMFSSLEMNHAYDETDVMVSLGKLKQHLTTGVTLSMKNLFGITPNSLYGDEAGREDACAGRGPLHSRGTPSDPEGFARIRLPGLKDGVTSNDPGWRVPRIVADICAARPIHLAIIDGITAMSGGEGPWCGEASPLAFTQPGLLLAGLNPVSTDAVATALMGYADPRAAHGTRPFVSCDNHLLLAEQSGLGTADLSQIDVRGTPIDQARCPYRDLPRA